MLTPYYCYSSIESNTFLTCVSYLDLCTLIKKHLTRTLTHVHYYTYVLCLKLLLMENLCFTYLLMRNGTQGHKSYNLHLRVESSLNEIIHTYYQSMANSCVDWLWSMEISMNWRLFVFFQYTKTDSLIYGISSSTQLLASENIPNENLGPSYIIWL